MNPAEKRRGSRLGLGRRRRGLVALNGLEEVLRTRVGRGRGLCRLVCGIHLRGTLGCVLHEDELRRIHDEIGHCVDGGGLI